MDNFVTKSFNDGKGWFWLFVILTLFERTIFDKFVNDTLINVWGLAYNDAWFHVYAGLMAFSTIIVALFVATVYWISSPRYQRKKMTFFAIAFTLASIFISGALDFLWFMMRGFFPLENPIWWWMPMYFVFGIEWTVVHHMVYTLVWMGAIGLVWWEERKGWVAQKLSVSNKTLTFPICQTLMLFSPVRFSG